MDILKSGYEIFEATSDQVKILDSKIDQFNAQQLSFTGDLELEKNYLIQDENGIIIAQNFAKMHDFFKNFLREKS